MNVHVSDTILDLAGATQGRKFRTILADPPWRFITGPHYPLIAEGK